MKIFYDENWIQVQQNDIKARELNIVINDSAWIGNSAEIEVIIAKYNCNRYNNVIRIGCETHPIEKWQDIEFQENLANKHEWKWWNERGKKILNFLID